jgi:pimeloyl-ACP methyl ester carboxylesterase
MKLLEEMTMNVVQSPDGTKIAYDKQGDGPALIAVDGALCTRSFGSKPELTGLLARHLTVYSYDRRGRGDSGDTLPYAVDREIEDITALIDEAGGSAALYGHSSGAALAMEAAIRLGSGTVTRLAMYEAPYNDDPAAQQAWGEYITELTAALAAGRPGDAVAAFMALVGTPAEQIAGMRTSPFWPAMEAVGPTLAYDHTHLLGKHAALPVERAARVPVPALVMYGEASFPFMADTARALARAMPRATLRALPGQTHEVAPAALAPVLTDFLAG